MPGCCIVEFLIITMIAVPEIRVLMLLVVQDVSDNDGKREHSTTCNAMKHAKPGVLDASSCCSGISIELLGLCFEQVHECRVHVNYHGAWSAKSEG